VTTRSGRALVSDEPTVTETKQHPSRALINISSVLLLYLLPPVHDKDTQFQSLGRDIAADVIRVVSYYNFLLSS
jgi:hypothetical protein